MEIKYLIIVFGLIVGSIYKPIIAATYYVNDNSTANDIYCSAVGAAGNTGLTPNSPKATIAQVIALTGAGSHTIYIDNGTYAEVNINLSGENLIILGAGVERTIFNNLNANAVFTTNPTSAYTITFQDLSIKNYSSTTTGVGILFTPTNSSTLNLNNVVVSGCNILTPPGSSGRGPILVYGSLNIKGGGFFCNGSASSPGGAIEIASTGGGTVSIFGTAFIGNTKTNQSNQMPYGAAICIGNVTNAAAANISISDCLFDGNTIATGSGTNGQGGSAIFINNNIANTVTIKNCIIKNGNVASNQSGFGVACNFYRGVINVSKTLFDNNTITSGATNEGAVGVQYANVVLDTCKFSNNTAATYSDVTLTQAGASVTATNCTFSSSGTNLYRANGTFTIDKCGNPNRTGSFSVTNTTSPITFTNPTLASWSGSCPSGYSQSSGGPVVVTATVGTLGPTYYDNLRLAFLAVNAGTHRGVITMSITANLYDDNSAVLNASGVGSASYTSINITPNNTWTVQGTIASAPQIDLNGADNVTIDGRINGAGSTESLTLINNSATASNNCVIRLYNDATVNTIRYCFIKSSTTNSSSGAILVSSASAGGNDNNTIDNCIFQEGTGGYMTNCIYSSGSASNENSGITVSNCEITDHSRYGVYLFSNSNNWTFSGNHFYQNNGSTQFSGITADVMQLYINAGATYNILSNYFGGQAPSCGGSAFTFNTSYNFYSIYITATSSVNIKGNYFQNFSLTTNKLNGSIAFINAIGTANYTIGTSTPGDENTFGSTSGTGNINATLNTNSISFYAVVSTASGTTLINNNIFGGISVSGTRSGGASYLVYSNAGTNNVNYNVFGNTTANNIVLGCLGNSGIINVAVNTNNLTQTVCNNSIKNINSTNSGTAISDYFSGIWMSTTGTGVAMVCTTNTIGSTTTNNITCAGGITNYGIQISGGGTYSYTLDNNIIQQFNNTNVNTSFDGILNSSTTATITSCTGNNIKNITCAGNTASTSFSGIEFNTAGTISNCNILDISIASVFYGINARANAAVTITGCTIGGSNPALTTISGTLASSSYGIYLSNSTSNTATIINNNIQYVTVTNNANTEFYGIYNFAGVFTSCDNNNINNITYGAISFCGGIKHLSSSGSRAASITNNNIHTYSLTSGRFYGIFSNSSNASNTITGNVIGSTNTSPNINISSTSASFHAGFVLNSSGTYACSSNTVQQIGNSANVAALIYGFELVSTGTYNLTSNTIQNLFYTNAGANAANIIGIHNSAAGAGTLSKNKINGFSNTATSISAGIKGIQITNGNFNVYNNLILLNNASNTYDINVFGIEQLTAANALTNSYYHNTVKIFGSESAGTVSGANGLSACFKTDASAGTINLRNNILQNLRTSSASNPHYMCYISSKNNTKNIDYNYGAAPVAANYCFWEAAAVTYATWIGARVAGSGAINDKNAALVGAITIASDGTLANATEYGYVLSALDLSATVTDDIFGNSRSNQVHMGCVETNSFVSCTVTQANTTNIFHNTTNQVIIGIEIITSAATMVPLTVSSFSLNTTGTTQVSEIVASSVKLWTTGTSSSFATTTQLGAGQSTGSFTLNSGTNIPYTLASGTNYFWLTFDINAGSNIMGSVADAQCTSLTVGGVARTPTVTSPAGNRPIHNYQAYYVDDASNIGDLYTTSSVAGSDVSSAGTKTNPFATLKYAINNAVFAGDTIYVDKGTWNETAITINKDNLKIAGAGMSNTIFDSNNNSGYFATIEANDVIISDLKIQQYGNGIGGTFQAMSIGDGTNTYSGIKVNNVQFDGNGGSSGDMAIHVKSNTTSTFTGGGASCNSAGSYSGAMRITGTNINLTINNYLFFSNSGDCFGGSAGGAIRITSGDASQRVVIRNTLFMSNTNCVSTFNGLDIYMTTGDLKVYDCMFDSSASAMASGTAVGGSVRIDGGTAYFTRSRFIKNISTGGMRGCAIGNNGGTVSIDSCYFNSNSGSLANDVHCASGSIIARYCTWGEVGQSGGGIFSMLNSGNPTVIEGSVTKSNTITSGFIPVMSLISYSGSCGSISITSTTILPIKLLNFYSRCHNNAQFIYWQTSSETNNEKFQIFHSLDGESFKVIGGIKGAGNSTEIKNYSFQHKEAPLGKNYYKLRQIDFDGNYTDSKVVVFDGRCANLNFNTESIYYNAVNNMLNLTLNSLVDERGCFSLLDVSGRIIFKESFNINKHTDLYTFSMPLLSNGVYLVTLSDDGGGQYSQKIVINR